MAAKSDAGRDRGDDERDASDADEDAETANEVVLPVVLDHGCPRRPLLFRKSVDRVAENAEADAVHRLPGAVEDDVERKRDSADCRGRALDAAQKHVDHDGHQWDEEQHPNVDHQHARHLVLQVAIELVALPSWVKEQQDRPGKRHPNQKHELTAA